VAFGSKLIFKRASLSLTRAISCKCQVSCRPASGAISSFKRNNNYDSGDIIRHGNDGGYYNSESYGHDDAVVDDDGDLGVFI